MTVPRRFLPATSLLRAFEASARHGSFTLAASELHLTQSAISRQIRALEEILGAELFQREKQRVMLTLAGSVYAREVRASLDRISTATLNFRANPVGGSLHLSVPPLFGARWLAPRLSGFLASYPEYIVNLCTRSTPFDFEKESVDAAIDFGVPKWPGIRLALLMTEVAVPVCSPALKDQLRFEAASDLIAAPLLHLAGRPDAWERWFAAHAVTAGEVHGMLVDQFAFAISAATANLGVALLPKFLIARELTSGELVMALDAPVRSAERYYLASPPALDGYPPLDAFRGWLLNEVSNAEAASRD